MAEVDNAQQDAVRGGEDRALVVSGTVAARAVALAVQSFLSKRAQLGREFAGQGGQVLVAHPGQGRLGQQVEDPSASSVTVCEGYGLAVAGAVGADGVVPGAVRVVVLDRQAPQLGLADRDAQGVAPGVEFGFDPQSAAGLRRRDGVDDDFVAGQRAAPPVHRDVGEESVLDLVPLRGARREVTDSDCQPCLGGEFG